MDIPDLSAWLVQKTEQIDQAIQGAGINTEAYAKQACPVGTPESTGIKGYVGGRLRSSISYTPGYLKCSVGTNVEYGPYVELGTYKMAARPFLFPASVQAGQELIQELQDIFNS